MRGRWSGIAVVVLGLALAAGLVALGRASVGHAAGQAASPGYADGVRDGRAAGLAEGRALGVPGASRDAFRSGYVAGANDAFSGYDGGWSFGQPYLVTLAHPDGPIGYRITSRVEMASHVDYYLCPDGRTVCQRPHR
jgi:hypothetical protein